MFPQTYSNEAQVAEWRMEKENWCVATVLSRHHRRTKLAATKVNLHPTSTLPALH